MFSLHHFVGVQTARDRTAVCPIPGGGWHAWRDGGRMRHQRRELGFVCLQTKFCSAPPSKERLTEFHLLSTFKYFKDKTTPAIGGHI